MKKTAALLLILLTVCAVSAAVAQNVEIYREDSLFYIQVALPDGARVLSTTTDETLSMTELSYAAQDKPSVVITAAPDETYVGLSLSDLTKEEVDLIVNEITMEMASPAVELRTAPGGYEYIVLNESTETNDVCDTVTLVNGYFIMVHVFYADYHALTAQDMEIGPSIVESFQFVGSTNS
jgi:hypothetical protein